jgi:hypothetical protein
MAGRETSAIGHQALLQSERLRWHVVVAVPESDGYRATWRRKVEGTAIIPPAGPRSASIDRTSASGRAHSLCRSRVRCSRAELGPPKGQGYYAIRIRFIIITIFQQYINHADMNRHRVTSLAGTPDRNAARQATKRQECNLAPRHPRSRPALRRAGISAARKSAFRCGAGIRLDHRHRSGSCHRSPPAPRRSENPGARPGTCRSRWSWSRRAG